MLGPSEQKRWVGRDWTDCAGKKFQLSSSKTEILTTGVAFYRVRPIHNLRKLRHDTANAGPSLFAPQLSGTGNVL
ncbi:hypothetical protein CEE69_00215 [Rhodopirellula bahusiensis]|uniref:Uncharacterized protein n=1 Tax=Rhodopirellula bahusiensis TaxID=2014065 RepID=A0A2G1WCV8_9BACT|nr:hypothetical protein CEE69_00215 [Rhodopirellula bahusiensis]